MENKFNMHVWWTFIVRETFEEQIYEYLREGEIMFIPMVHLVMQDVQHQEA